jgi:uncharacterized protein RhaS with RHS repeats
VAGGQFTQIDPIGLRGGLNLYAFGAGDPVNFSDPFGLEVIFANAEAEQLWHSLLKQAKAAASSKDPAKREAGKRLVEMMNEMFGDTARVYSVNVANMTDQEFQDTWGGSEVTAEGLNHKGKPLSAIIIDPRARAGPLTTLAHELGGARSRQVGGAHDGPAVATENKARRAFGCSGSRGSHGEPPTPCK